MFHKPDLLPRPPVEHTKLRSCTSVDPGLIERGSHTNAQALILIAIIVVIVIVTLTAIMVIIMVEFCGDARCSSWLRTYRNPAASMALSTRMLE